MKITKKQNQQLMKLNALLRVKGLHLNNLLYDLEHCRSESMRKIASNQIFMAELGIKNIKTSIEIINS